MPQNLKMNKQKTSKTKQLDKAKQNIYRRARELVLCCPGVCLINPMALHWGKLILPLTSWYQLQINFKVGEDTSLLVLGTHLA